MAVRVNFIKNRRPEQTPDHAVREENSKQRLGRDYNREQGIIYLENSVFFLHYYIFIRQFFDDEVRLKLFFKRMALEYIYYYHEISLTLLVILHLL